jgi:hypothetical protein
MAHEYKDSIKLLQGIEVRNLNKLLFFVAMLLPLNALAETVYVYQYDILLGSVGSYSGATTARGNWNRNYGVDVGPVIADNEGALFFYEGLDGLTFNMLFNPNEVLNQPFEYGSIAFDISVTGTDSSVFLTDDINEFVSSGGGNYSGKWKWTWGADGGIIGGLEGDWTIDIFNMESGWSSRYPNGGSSLWMYGVDGFFSLDLSQDIRLTNVSPVPLPATAWLFGSALLGFAGFNRFKAKTT